MQQKENLFNWAGGPQAKGWESREAERGKRKGGEILQERRWHTQTINQQPGTPVIKLQCGKSLRKNNQQILLSG